MKVLIDRAYRFINTAHQWIANGGETVEFEEACDRLDICRGCDFNVKDGDGCLGCFSRKAIMALFGYLDGKHKRHEGLIRANEIPNREEIGYCGKCKCALKVKAFLPTHIIDNGNIDYPDHCWQNEEDEISTIQDS